MDGGEVGPYEVTVVRRVNGEWETEPAVSPEEAPFLRGVVVDPHEHISVLYDAGEGSTWLATNACGAWESSRLDAEVAWAGLGLDSSGRPLVAFSTAAPAQGVWVATR